MHYRPSPLTNQLGERVLREDKQTAPASEWPTAAATTGRLKSQRVELITRCTELARFLRGVNESNWANWFDARVTEIRLGQAEGIDNLLGGFVGLGNIGDVFLCPEAGHSITARDETAMNEQFLLMLSKVSAVALDVQTLLGGPVRDRAAAMAPC